MKHHRPTHPRWSHCLGLATLALLAVSIPPLAGAGSVVLQRGGDAYEATIAGDFAYVGQGATVVTLGFPDGVPPKVVHTTEALPGLVWGMAVKDDVLFVSWNGLESEITLFSLADPSRPERLADYSYDAGDEPRGLELVGDTLFVADAELGLVPVDVSEPTAPVAGQPVGSRYEHVTSTGTGYLVVGHYFDLSIPSHLIMTSYDISDPAQPVLGGQFSEAVRYGVVAGSDFAVAYPNSDRIWSLSDPLDPVSMPFEPPEGYEQLVTADRLYQASPDAIYTWDLTDPNVPIAGPTVDLPISLYRAWAGAVSPDRQRTIFVDDQGWVVDLDTADPDAPSLRQLARMSTPGWSWFVSRLGPNLIVQGHGGLRLVNQSLQTLEFYEDLTEITPLVLADREPLLMLGLPSELQLADFSDPAAPQVISSLAIEWPAAAAWSDDGLAWVATRDFFDPSSSRLATVDLGDPTNPEILSTLPIFGGSDLAVEDSTLYLADLDGGLRTYDVTKTPPEPLGQYTECDEVEKVEVVDSLAILACGPGFFHLVDVADPARPARLATYGVPVPPHFIQPKVLFRRQTGADRFFVGYPGGLDVVDVSDPARPVRSHQIPLAGTVAHMEPAKGGLWIAARFGGMARIRLEDDGGPLGNRLMPQARNSSASKESRR